MFVFTSWRAPIRRYVAGAVTAMAVVAVASAPAQAESGVRARATTADGFAATSGMGVNGTTGGAGGPTVTVTNYTDLVKYATATTRT